MTNKVVTYFKMHVWLALSMFFAFILILVLSILDILTFVSMFWAAGAYIVVFVLLSIFIYSKKKANHHKKKLKND